MTLIDKDPSQEVTLSWDPFNEKEPLMKKNQGTSILNRRRAQAKAPRQRWAWLFKEHKEAQSGQCILSAGGTHSEGSQKEAGTSAPLLVSFQGRQNLAQCLGHSQSLGSISSRKSSGQDGSTAPQRQSSSHGGAVDALPIPSFWFSSLVPPWPLETSFSAASPHDMLQFPKL